MKNSILKQFLKLTATAIACAAFSIAVPAPDVPRLPSPDNIVGGQVIETPGAEDEGDDNEEPGISPMNNKDENNEKITSTLS